jgi:GNAT superfamily N-acetyltransferase
MMADIRKLQASDEAAWQPLWQGYLRFYRHRLPQEVTEYTFRRLVEGRVYHAVVAEADGRLAGFAHYLFHPSSWSLADSCYLEDLYVTPEVRGQGIGRSLLQRVYAEADAAGAGTVYWMTQEFNADGRALYDTLARRTSFIKYER